MQFDFNTEFEQMMQTSDLDTVVLLGHVNPDGDAAGSVMGLAHYIKINYPQYTVLPYLADTLEKGPKKQVKADKIFDPFKKPDLKGRRTAAIVCDTSLRTRIIGREYYEGAAATMVIDHHASNEGYGKVNYTRISEACAENIYNILDQKSLKKAVAAEESPTAADYIYLGILHDTGGFTRVKASTMQAAADLLAIGVDHSYVMHTMHNDTLESLKKRFELLKSARYALEGAVAFISVSQAEKLAKGISYADIHPISGLLCDCEGIELGFTLFEESNNVWRCSARSDGKWINVNELLKPFGGGGHAAAAGLTKETDDVEQLKQQILKRIQFMKRSL